MINTSRRKTLKLVSASMATAGAATLAPLTALARLIPTPQDVPVETLPDSLLDMEFVDSKSIDGFVALGQATLVNRSARDLLLTDFTPALITTANASYDLAAHLKFHPVVVAAGQRLRFWVRPVTTTDKYGFARLVPVPESGASVPEATVATAGSEPRSQIVSNVALTIKSPAPAIPDRRQNVAATLDFAFRSIA